MIGIRFDKLLVIGEARVVLVGSKLAKVRLCRCDCGVEIDRVEHRLKNGQNTSCGCKRRTPKPVTRDLTGRVFTHLTVVSYAYKLDGRNRWNCICACGNTATKSEKLLLNGDTKSCGCRNGLPKVEKIVIIKPTKYEVFLNNLFRRYISDANKRGFNFALSKQNMAPIIESNCYYCGSPPSNGKHFKYSGLDRVDSRLGYEESNVVACCIICNKAKSNLSVTDFFENMKRLWAHL